MLANKVVCRYLFDVCNLLGCCIEEDANLLQNCLFTNTTSIGHYQGPPVLPGACPVAAWSTFLSHFFWTAMDQSYFCSMWLKSFNWSRTAASVLMHSQMTFKCTVTHFRQIPLSFLAVCSLYRTSTSLDGQQSSPSQFNKKQNSYGLDRPVGYRRALLRRCTFPVPVFYRLSVFVTLVLFWTVILHSPLTSATSSLFAISTYASCV